MVIRLRSRAVRGAVVIAWLATLSATSLGACVFHSADDCEVTHTCPPVTDGGVPTGCDPSKSAGPVADSCGVFVSVSGDDGNAGTKEKPVKTIGAALGKGTAIYACAGAMPFSKAVTVSKAATLFGALDCTTWGYDATNKTQLTAAADAVPLTLGSAAGGSEVHDFAITAADAMTAGGSSIAIIDDGASLVLERVSVTAGAGAKGDAGAVQMQVVTAPTADGSMGQANMTCMLAGPIAGGGGGKNMCGGIATSGGVGGQGIADVSGGNGNPGNPMLPSNGGSGQVGAASCNASDPKGADGTSGSGGMGARGIGDISSTGYLGATGMVGMAGSPGQGGGGGGGAHACDSPTDMFAGPSGGGGGAGGCPGEPGNLGQSGGSSIGILVLGAAVTLKTASITTHDGGGGGTGGDGQLGGNGGQPGNAGGGASCSGGKGGQGGAGGPGGGGAGGHSIAIAMKGGTLPDLSSTTTVPGMGGSGGPGGNMDMTAQTKGDDGLACKTLDFATPTSCAM
jgi:hypothetical protein